MYLIRDRMYFIVKAPSDSTLDEAEIMSVLYTEHFGIEYRTYFYGGSMYYTVPQYVEVPSHRRQQRIMFSNGFYFNRDSVEDAEFGELIYPNMDHICDSIAMAQEIAYKYHLSLLNSIDKRIIDDTNLYTQKLEWLKNRSNHIQNLIRNYNVERT